MTSTTRKTLATLAVAGTLFGAAACGSNSNDASASSSDMSSSSPSASSSTMANPAADLVGPGCGAYAKAVPNGAGSVAGMAQDKVAVAASNNPLLTTLVAAVSGKLNPKVNLVPALNNGEYTVFAPVDDAFAKLPKSTVATLKTPAGADTLKKVLTYHVISGQIAPSQIDGSHKTLEGSSVTVKGTGDNIVVDGHAHVICGGVHTANATVYLIDEVLMPKK
ncbi:MAG: fasciclin domain-containing protein [Marmoricola sp.]